jgi:uncharacterized membrane protein YkvA (DUF1232 family)
VWAGIVAWAKALRRDVMTLWFATRHPDTPLLPKLLAICVAAYALSPIDLIPDFIPVLGYLDEVILLPGAIWLCLRLIPPPVLTACRQQADQWFADRRGKPVSLAGAAFIGLVWVVLLAVGWRIWQDWSA